MHYVLIGKFWTFNFKSNRHTFSILCKIDYFRFRPGVYRYQVIGKRPSPPDNYIQSCNIDSAHTKIVEKLLFRTEEHL